MTTSNVQLVIFDLDGVLTETSAYHFKAWKALAKDFGVRLSDDFETKLKGVSRAESLERILSEYHLEEKFNEEEKAALLYKKNAHYQQLIEHMSAEHLYEGVIDCFMFLKKHDVNIAIGSASKNAPTIIKALKIGSYIDYLVDPRNLNSKPAPDIFLDAMKHFNLSPSQCIGIEDAHAGIKAINKANMLSIGIGECEDLSQADYCFTSIKDISKTLMEKLIKGESV